MKVANQRPISHINLNNKCSSCSIGFLQASGSHLIFNTGSYSLTESHAQSNLGTQVRYLVVAVGR